MTLLEMATYIGAIVRKSDDATVNRIKEFLKLRHRLIVDSALWKDTLCYTSFKLRRMSTAAGGGYDSTVTVPYPVGRILGVRLSNSDVSLRPADMSVSFQVAPSVFEALGTPVGFTEVDSVGVPWQMSLESAKLSADPRSLPSVVPYAESGDDLSKKVHMEGTIQHQLSDGSIYYSEGGMDVSLQAWSLPPAGRTPAPPPPTMADSMVFVRSVTKPETVGNVRLVMRTGVADAGAWGETYDYYQMALVPKQTVGHRFARFRWLEKPEWQGNTYADALTCYVLGKAQTRDMLTDSDVPMVRGIEQVLLAHAMADCYEWLRQFGKAQVKRQEAISLMDVVRDLELNQSANQILMQPAALDLSGRDQFFF